MCLSFIHNCDSAGFVLQGLLFAYHNDFARLARQERTDVFQDYAMLASKVIESVDV